MSDLFEKFEAHLRSLYERPELRQRFPNGFEPIQTERSK